MHIDPFEYPCPSYSSKGRIPEGLLSEDLFSEHLKNTIWEASLLCVLSRWNLPLTTTYNSITSLSSWPLTKARASPAFLIFLTIRFYYRYAFSSVNMPVIAKLPLKQQQKKIAHHVKLNPIPLLRLTLKNSLFFFLDFPQNYSANSEVLLRNHFFWMWSNSESVSHKTTSFLSEVSRLYFPPIP